MSRRETVLLDSLIMGPICNVSNGMATYQPPPLYDNDDDARKAAGTSST
jgi:hypothetical protein